MPKQILAPLKRLRAFKESDNVGIFRKLVSLVTIVDLENIHIKLNLINDDTSTFITISTVSLKLGYKMINLNYSLFV